MYVNSGTSSPTSSLPSSSSSVASASFSSQLIAFPPMPSCSTRPSPSEVTPTPGCPRVISLAAANGITPIPPSKLSKKFQTNLNKLMDTLKQKSFYFNKGPLIEAIQLYIEEQLSACDLLKNSAYDQPFKDELTKYLSVNIRMIRCILGSYAKGASPIVALAEMKRTAFLSNTISVLKDAIKKQLATMQSSRPSVRRFHNERMAPLKDLLEVHEVIQELSLCEEGLNFLNQSQSIVPNPEQGEQLVLSVIQRYKILEKDLDPNLTLRQVKNPIDENKKEIQKYCMDLIHQITSSRQQFEKWANGPREMQELTTIYNGLHEIVPAMQNPPQGQTCRTAKPPNKRRTLIRFTVLQV